MTVHDIMNEIKEKKGIERRKYLRLPVELPCCLKYWKENGKDGDKERITMYGRVCNLSEGGVCLETPAMTHRSRLAISKKASNLKVIFQLSFPSELIDSHVDVAWSRNVSRAKDHFGLKFVHIAKEEQDKIVLNIINQIVERNLKKNTHEHHLAVGHSAKEHQRIF